MLLLLMTICGVEAGATVLVTVGVGTTVTVATAAGADGAAVPHADSASAIKTAAARISLFFRAGELCGNSIHIISILPIPGPQGAGGA